VKGGVFVTGEGDQAHQGVILTQASDCCHAVEHGHVQVDHRRVRLEQGSELDGFGAVCGRSDHVQFGLTPDQGAQRGEESLVVVGEQDVDRPLSHPQRG